MLAPASYTETLAIGASDFDDQPAWFSGRGPSPLTAEMKPLLLAPGTQILSAFPGDTYAPTQWHLHGHAPCRRHHRLDAGSGSLGLTLPQVRDSLADTAVPVAAIHPNYDSGWGRLDAYAAVLSQLPHGRLNGAISHNGNPRPDVSLSVTRSDGFELTTRTGAHKRQVRAFAAAGHL